MNKRLEELRQALGISQEDLGAKINLKRAAISMYETGKRNLSDRVISDICREFNVNEIWLRTGEGEMFLKMDREDELAQWAGSLLSPNNDNEFMKKFVHMLSKLDASDWDVLAKMATLMAEDHNEKD
ncbi:helix-turn-helix transcriptional regulator [Ruminiclostridium herbifermentans]|uniref:Helix-turn-helix transcriptional regulator n=1 Tax=Ruminiclostridium herbifermentans TaxID=2488810 RepID=A0A4U7J940_9FIRM|nr:helix-turn-helix transcriptional regulator [Ruminiclostridium herbifermentans]QNU66943.1 helix-turn-helix transcriptional regulator [Ruminiclostridium herbifermentans]